MTAVYITKTAKDGAGNAFNAALQDQDGSGASVAGVHALRNAAGADINPATSELQTAANASLASIAANTATGSAIIGASMPSGGVGVTGWLSAIWTKLSGTLSVSTASLPLPTGAAQEAGNLAAIAANSATAATASAQATGNASLATIAANSGTQATAAAQATGNASLSTIATNSGTQATAANQTTGNTSLSAISTATGAQADAAYVSGSGGVIAILKGIFGKVSATLAVSAASLPLPAGAAIETGGNLATIATRISGTLPISAAALPLPTGAAAETGGNLAAIATATGGVSDTAYVSGSGSVIALLKGIFGKLAGTLAVSGTFWQVTQPVSAASLPLPTGAATAALQPAINGDGGAQTHIMNQVSADAVAAAGIIPGATLLYNGTTYDRQRSGGQTGSALVAPYDNAASAAVSTVVTSNSGQNVVCPLNGFNGGVISIVGTFTGLNGIVYASYDGGATYTITPMMRNANSGGVIYNGATGAISASVTYEFFAPGATHVKYLSTGWTSGTANIRIAPIVIMPHPLPNVTQGPAGANSWLVQAKTATAGGIPTSTQVYGAITPAVTTVKSSAGQLYALDLVNNAASTWAYLHIFITSPTLGTTAAALTYGIAPNSARSISFGALGLQMAAIYASISSAPAQADNTAMAAANTAIAVFQYN